MIDTNKIMTWSDITVGQYQELISIQTESEIAAFIQMVSIALDCDQDDIRNLTLKDWQTIKTNFQFLTSDPQNDFSTFIDFHGVELGIEPDINFISTGVFIDAEQFRQDPIENLHRTLALIYRPVIEKESETEYKIQNHTGEGFEKRAEFFRKEVSIEKVFGATLFFFILSGQLSIDMTDYLKEVMMQELTTAGIV